ncbi:MAG: glucose-1-phosphate cytidylyltransferase [Candidatus Binatia bacterium]
MKAVILAGGLGSRLSEETTVRPKPMVEIGGKPILWHIMKNYSVHGINDFIICCGYKGSMIKKYFVNYGLYGSDVVFDMKNGKIKAQQNSVEPWTITLVDTGEETMTGGRLRRVKEYIGQSTFCLTYGDGVSDVDIRQLISFHRNQKALATVTAVQPPGRFGSFSLERRKMKISSFIEKPQGDGAWINGGYFVLEPSAIEYVADDRTIWEQGPLQDLARDGMLAAYRHHGFWQCMDTQHDKAFLEKLWASGKAPWKVWG